MSERFDAVEAFLNHPIEEPEPIDIWAEWDYLEELVNHGYIGYEEAIRMFHDAFGIDAEQNRE